jgi:hypothetical protein
MSFCSKIYMETLFPTSGPGGKLTFDLGGDGMTTETGERIIEELNAK